MEANNAKEALSKFTVKELEHKLNVLLTMDNGGGLLAEDIMNELDDRYENGEGEDDDEDEEDETAREEVDVEKSLKIIRGQTIEKAAGDRGGKVIGYTKSGKPIYEHSLYTSSNFSNEDHRDAITAHAKEAVKYNNLLKDKTAFGESRKSDDEREEIVNKRNHHKSMSGKHAVSSNFKTKNIQKSSLDISRESTLDIIKGAKGTIGEIREWSGKKYKKQANGKWLEVSDYSKKSKEKSPELKTVNAESDVIEMIKKLLPHTHQKDADHNARVMLNQYKDGTLKSGVIYNQIKKLMSEKEGIKKEHSDEEVGGDKTQEIQSSRYIDQEDIRRARSIVTNLAPGKYKLTQDVEAWVVDMRDREESTSWIGKSNIPRVKINKVKLRKGTKLERGPFGEEVYLEGNKDNPIWLIDPTIFSDRGIRKTKDVHYEELRKISKITEK